jgi:antitoxin component YwqK of YwqJK toxin-antitoxin module
MRVLLLGFLSLCVFLNSYAQNQTDSEGKKQGVWKKYHENGRLRYTGKFVNNLEVDTFSFYDNKGRIISKRIYETPGGEAKVLLYNFKEQLRAVGTMNGRKKIGKWVFFQTNVARDTLKIENYSDDKLEGFQFTYFKNKQLASKIKYKNGFKEGHFIEYYNNGQIQIEGVFIKDEYDGKLVRFHKSGKQKAIEYYLKGKRIGIWKIFDIYGKLFREIDYTKNE